MAGVDTVSQSSESGGGSWTVHRIIKGIIERRKSYIQNNLGLHFEGIQAVKQCIMTSCSSNFCSNFATLGSNLGIFALLEICNLVNLTTLCPLNVYRNLKTGSLMMNSKRFEMHNY